MRTSLLLPTLLLSTLAACGGDDDGAPPIDAAPAIDAPPSPVAVVTCPATPDAEVTAPGFAYTISRSSLPVGAVVKFTMPALHDANSGPVNGGVPAPDGKFRVAFGATVCLRFTVAGTYPFYCGPHLFTGSLTITP